MWASVSMIAYESRFLSIAKEPILTPCPLASISSIFIASIIAWVAGEHLYGTTVSTVNLLKRSPNDNRIDIACRIIMLLWLGLSLLMLLSPVAYRLWRGRFPRNTFGLIFWVLGWYICYFMLMVLLSMLKDLRGYHDPSEAPHVYKPPEYKSGWEFCLTLGMFTYCYSW